MLSKQDINNLIDKTNKAKEFYEPLKKELEALNFQNLKKIDEVKEELKKMNIKTNFSDIFDNPMYKEIFNNETTELLKNQNIDIDLFSKKNNLKPIRPIEFSMVNDFKKLNELNNKLLEIQEKMLEFQGKTLEFQEKSFKLNNQILEQQVIMNESNKQDSEYQKKINNIIIFLTALSIIVTLWIA